jgi:hypothetical protein
VVVLRFWQVIPVTHEPAGPAALTVETDSSSSARTTKILIALIRFIDYLLLNKLTTLFTYNKGVLT